MSTIDDNSSVRILTYATYGKFVTRSKAISLEAMGAVDRFPLAAQRSDKHGRPPFRVSVLL
jgi:hypothetical protein